MKLQAQVEIKLRDLMESGALPASQCGQAFLKLLAPMLDGGVLDWKRSGGGRRLVVNNADALRDFFSQRFPEATLPIDAGSRITSVSRFRDTKTMANNENEIISVRAWRNNALLKDGKPIDAATTTAAHNVFSFFLTKNCPYELRGPCALVENPAVFAVAEQLNLGVGLIIYGHGRISNRAIDWLTRMIDSSFSILHMPDYDPVGLSEFQRLQAQFGKRVVLHMPDDLETRFAKFSNRELLKKGNSQAMLVQLRRSNLSAIRGVIELIDRYNAGLEQEALLIKI
jgi:Protein of unknown function C-terminus (DUF2399)